MSNNNEERMDASLNFCLPPYKSANVVKLGFIAANIICNKKNCSTENKIHLHCGGCATGVGGWSWRYFKGSSQYDSIEHSIQWL